MSGLLVLVVLFGLIFLGIPISYALLIAGAGAMYVAGIPLITIPIQMFYGANEFTLLAVPLFIVMGEMMSVTMIADRLVRFASSLVGWIRGGLGHVNVLTNMFVAEMSGSATADAAMLTKVFVPGMEKVGYPKAYAAALTSVSATLGIIIPPSIPMILYGVMTNTSISDLFIGGIAPGIMLGGALMMTNYLFVRNRDYAHPTRFDPREVVASGRDAGIPLLIPFIIIGGMIGGIFTSTEAAGIGVLVTLIFGAFVSKSLTVKTLIEVCSVSAKQSGIVMLLVAGSVALGQFLASEQLPQKIVAGMGGLIESPFLTLLLINLFVLAVGVVLNAAAAIIIVVPILMPLAAAIHLDPVHFGIIVTLNLAIGQQTPPVASVLLTVCAMSNLKVQETFAYLKWFLLTMLIVLMTVSYVPATVLWFR